MDNDVDTFHWSMAVLFTWTVVTLLGGAIAAIDTNFPVIIVGLGVGTLVRVVSDGVYTMIPHPMIGILGFVSQLFIVIGATVIAISGSQFWTGVAISLTVGVLIGLWQLVSLGDDSGDKSEWKFDADDFDDQNT